MNSSNTLIKFAKSISGEYSNFKQAQQNPQQYAHIKIYFRPLKNSIMKGGWFYSEQSYDHAPWSPYRQGVHQLSIIDDLIIVENYKLKNAERIAGGGFYPEILSEIKSHLLTKREGCSMYFTKGRGDFFRGHLQPGHKCTIKMNNKLTYLTSYVEINGEDWNSLDEGFDISSGQKLWGSEFGPLHFKKIKSLGGNITATWLNSK